MLGIVSVLPHSLALVLTLHTFEPEHGHDRQRKHGRLRLLLPCWVLRAAGGTAPTNITPAVLLSH